MEQANTTIGKSFNFVKVDTNGVLQDVLMITVAQSGKSSGAITRPVEFRDVIIKENHKHILQARVYKASKSNAVKVKDKFPNLSTLSLEIIDILGLTEYEVFKNNYDLIRHYLNAFKTTESINFDFREASSELNEIIRAMDLERNKALLQNNNSFNSNEVDVLKKKLLEMEKDREKEREATNKKLLEMEKLIKSQSSKAEAK